jgi:aspartyl-tRNA(Asn)/glutamyl-tRNA(Gln) amidotransferase subunit B
MPALAANPTPGSAPYRWGIPEPRLNRRQVAYAVRLALALNSEVQLHNTFDRKNYFYADLPKGYQLTQDQNPICRGGYFRLRLPEGERLVRIHHVHMEEDAGKSMHDSDDAYSYIDLNRAGVPLLEIVTEPDLRSAEEVDAFMTGMRQLVRYLGISDGNMQEGSLRCDCNVSVRRRGETRLGNRCEIKNLNSMRYARRAIEYEVKRQIDLIEAGGRVAQQTLNFDPATGVTSPLRDKEDAHDYRYFPDPDLLPLMISPEWKARVQAEMPELPGAMKGRFMDDWGLSAYDATTLTASKEVADFYQATVSAAGAALAKPCANWVMGELAARLNKAELDVAASPVSPAQLAGLVARIADNTISNAIARKVFEALWNGEGATADEVIDKQGLRQVTDTGAIEAMIDEVLAANQKSVEEFRAGKEKAFNALVGQVMKASKGKAGPAQVNALLRKKLGA